LYLVYHARVECQDLRTLAPQACEFPGISCEAVLAADETVEYYTEYDIKNAKTAGYDVERVEIEAEAMPQPA
jgi:hypothetical protein